LDITRSNLALSDYLDEKCECAWAGYKAALSHHSDRVEIITLSASQLREALGFINPDGVSEPDQFDNELTFGIVQYQDDEGGSAQVGMCCWNSDTDGVYPLETNR
jgi:hypothetical protein